MKQCNFLEIKNDSGGACLINVDQIITVSRTVSNLTRIVTTGPNNCEIYAGPSYYEKVINTLNDCGRILTLD